MLDVGYGKRFEKDCGVLQKRRKNLDALFDIIACISLEEPLPERCRPHILSGNYDGLWECHIENDWILIYYPDFINQKAHFYRTGTHSDLF